MFFHRLQVLHCQVILPVRASSTSSLINNRQVQACSTYFKCQVCSSCLKFQVVEFFVWNWKSVAVSVKSRWTINPCQSRWTINPRKSLDYKPLSKSLDYKPQFFVSRITTFGLENRSSVTITVSRASGFVDIVRLFEKRDKYRPGKAPLPQYRERHTPPSNSSTIRTLVYGREQLERLKGLP